MGEQVGSPLVSEATFRKAIHGASAKVKYVFLILKWDFPLTFQAQCTVFFPVDKNKNLE